jgi:hypothetical protein
LNTDPVATFGECEGGTRRRSRRLLLTEQALMPAEERAGAEADRPIEVVYKIRLWNKPQALERAL